MFKLKSPIEMLSLTLLSFILASYVNKEFGLIGVTLIYIFTIALSTVRNNLILSAYCIASSFLSMEFFFIEPIYSFTVDGFESWLMLISFVISSVAIVYGRSISIILLPNKSKIFHGYLKYFIPILCITSIFWVSRVFNKPNIEQIIFHFEFSNLLLRELDKHLAISFFNNVILVSVIITCLLGITEHQVITSKSSSSLIELSKVIISRGVPLMLISVAITLATLS